MSTNAQCSKPGVASISVSRARSSDSCRFIVSGDCVSVRVCSITHISRGRCRLHRLGPPRPPSQLVVAQRGGRWKMCVLWTASHWDKAGSLLTRPRPSPRIFPPTSIDYAVGGKTASSVVFFPVSLFQQRHGQHRLPFLPNDIFAINCCLHGRSIIWAWHNQWRLPSWMRHFLNKHQLLSSAAPTRLEIGFADLVRHYSIWPCKEMREASGPHAR